MTQDTMIPCKAMLVMLSVLFQVETNSNDIEHNDSKGMCSLDLSALIIDLNLRQLQFAATSIPKQG